MNRAPPETQLAGFLAKYAPASYKAQVGLTPMSFEGQGKTGSPHRCARCQQVREAPIEALIIQALRAVKLPVEPKSHHRQLIIKSISMNQRPGRPSGARRSAKSTRPDSKS